MIKDRPRPGLPAQVTLAALSREVVGGCRRGVATLAIRESGVVKGGHTPVLYTGVAPAALGRKVKRGCVHGVTALAVDSVGVVEGGFAPGCRGVALTALAGKMVHGCDGSMAIPAIGETGVVEDGTDYGAIKGGYVSLTPLHLDLTAYQIQDELESLKWNLT